MATNCVMGIDVGTSGCKVILLDKAGNILASNTVGYPLYTPQPGYSEQDPAHWWNAVCQASNAVLKAAPEINLCALSFSGQMHGMVALDEQNNVVRRAILWNDQRTQAQCDEITQVAGGLDGLLNLTNNRMLTGYTGGKILWMKQNEPENFAKTHTILNPKDYIRFMITGQKITEVSDASGTGLFDVKNRCWSFELIDKLGFDRTIFPICVESTTLTGTVTKDAAKLLGVLEGTAVVGGGGDAVISTTGMGLVQPGRVGITLGTSGVVAMGLAGYMDNPGGNLQLFCNNKPGTWHAMGVTLSAAGSYQWFRNNLGSLEKHLEDTAGEDSYELLNAQAEKAPAGADRMVFLPYLMGERCPLNDPNAMGAFIGITQLHTKGHFARAVMEGVAFSLKQVFDLADSKDAKEVVVAGGGAKSELWKQIIADIFNLPVITVYGAAEGGAFGAALVAGVGCGLWDTMEEAMLLAKPESTTHPIPQNVSVYQKQYQNYCKLYGALKFYFDN